MLALCGMHSTLPPGADWQMLRSRGEKGLILVLRTHGHRCLFLSALCPASRESLWRKNHKLPHAPVESTTPRLHQTGPRVHIFSFLTCIFSSDGKREQKLRLAMEEKKRSRPRKRYA